jgi:MoaA/NifB/PqqE/SkfB family radical SAM enzyme
MRETVGRLASCGVNDLLVSVDAFHQETIPLCTVRDFISEAVRIGISVRLNPAWLVSPTDENPYNKKTREILGSFDGMNVAIGEGNVVFPEGNALKFLPEYFTKEVPENPYTEDPCRVKCVSFAPNGDVLGGNIYRSDIMEILERYAPK